MTQNPTHRRSVRLSEQQRTVLHFFFLRRFSYLQDKKHQARETTLHTREDLEDKSWSTAISVPEVRTTIMYEMVCWGGRSSGGLFYSAFY